ncbi:MAG: DUF2286 domain-containing protein [Candidatus Nezhaarchaeota archaeon]|nr:DUF2286 domain-containing protein [Candidatus Nezhaarchaeota archaeon]MCX8142213.1 DUF2286 domain-containing protein [Candidatus Nezhaarchaeota archaeon]MDW8050814.1 DUF2286 domain-containing protein [Nitrososphaerota archaeon]
MSKSRSSKKSREKSSDREEGSSEEKSVLIHSDRGSIKRVIEIEGPLHEAVKKAAFEALQLWNPEASDFVVMRDNYVKTLKLPLTREEYEYYSKFELKRSTDKAEAIIPIYVASFNNEWRDTDYYDNEVFIIAPKLPSEDLEELKKRAMLATSEEQLETYELGGLEEDLESLGEEEEGEED